MSGKTGPREAPTLLRDLAERSIKAASVKWMQKQVRQCNTFKVTIVCESRADQTRIFLEGCPNIPFA
jgi:hypothetical protein